MEYPAEKEILQDVAFWDSMRKEIFEYVQNCPVCQLEKENRKTGLREEISRPEKVWKQVSIDHIIKLSKSRGKDSILIIQDQMSRMIHLKAVCKKKKTKKV